MNTERSSSRRPAIVAACCVGAGLLLCVHAGLETRVTLKQVRAKQNRLAQLNGLGDRDGQARAQVAAFAAAEATAPAALKAMLGNVMPGAQADLVELEPRRLGHGVVARRVDLKLEKVALEDLGALMVRMERYRPPWKIRQCSIRATPGDAGHGQANLVVEALEGPAYP
jgi:hypothetical protein